MWTDDWVGISYHEMGRGPESYDCLGLFVALQSARFERSIFDPLCTTDEAIQREIAARQKRLWEPVETAREGDAVMFRVYRAPVHLGFALDDRRMLHTEKATGSLIEEFRGSRWGQRLEGIYRYVG